MRLIKIVFFFFYRLYFGLVFFLTGILFLPLLLVFVTGERKYRRAFHLKKVWAKIICILILVRIKVQGKENFPKDGSYIVCPNHSSYLDIILMYQVIPHEFAFLGKAEVLKWPIINLFFKRGIDIPVYRYSVKRAKECIDLSVIALNQGRSVAIFPEGGMVRSKKLRRFKNGAFSLSVQTKKLIIPITFKNNFDLFTDHSDFLGICSPGKAHVIIHEQINPGSFPEKDLISLRNHTYWVIKNELNNETG